MSNFNELQQGIPDLGKTYWQDLKYSEKESLNGLSQIVEMNCKTIFAPDDFKNITIYNPTIFKE